MTIVQKMTGWIIIVISADEAGARAASSFTAKSGNSEAHQDAERHGHDHRHVEPVGLVGSWAAGVRDPPVRSVCDMGHAYPTCRDRKRCPASHRRHHDRLPFTPSPPQCAA